MNDTTRAAVLAELKAMRRQLETVCNLVHGLYRLSKGEPRQQPLPGLVLDSSPLPGPGEIARSLPRRWSNTVKVYEALYGVFGSIPLTTREARTNIAVLQRVREETNNRVDAPTVAYCLATISRAGAAEKIGRGKYQLRNPTDELRAAVDEESRRRNHHPATKEAANA